MLENHGYRPPVETFEVAGGRFDLVDPAGILAGLGPGFEPVLQPGTFPPPFAEVEVLLAAGPRSGRPSVRFRALITQAAPVTDRRVHPAVVGVEYVAPLLGALSRLLAENGRPAADRPVADTPPAADPVADTGRTSTLTDQPSGLTATLTTGRARLNGRTTHQVDAEVPDAGPEHLAAFVRIVVRAARRTCDEAAEDFLAGRAYNLSRTAEGVRLDQLGGLDDVVAQLREVADSFRHPEAMARWGARRPQGVLMSGPPGTGKTTLAKALATEIGGTLKEIRTPDILDRWVGASERNIRKIFTEARRYRTPTVLLFDEFDSIISYTGSPGGAADQAINSVAGIFKQEMNTLVEENPNVIVVATTNFPERVDESLTRSGRFDVKIAIPLPDLAARVDILTSMLRRLVSRHETGGFRMFADDVDVTQLAVLTAGMSGADLKELLRRAQMAKAMQEARGSGEVAAAIGQDDLERVVALMRRPGGGR